MFSLPTFDTLTERNDMPVIGVEWDDRTRGALVYAKVNGRNEFLIRKIHLVPTHIHADTGRQPRWEILALDALSGSIGPCNILRCRSLEKAKIAVLKEIASPGHCARIRERANNRRTGRTSA